MKNGVDREIPEKISVYEEVIPFKSPFGRRPSGNYATRPIKSMYPGEKKLLGTIEEAIDAVELKDGMSISFHHHLRNGDYVMNMVMDAIAEKGIKDITIFPTAMFPIHKELIKHIESGVITAIHGSVNGPVGRKVSEGAFNQPLILRSHGGRARAIEAGDIDIDVAFVAAPTADEYGNITGKMGKSSCGALGYIMTDAQYAKKVVAITDNLQPYPISPISISQNLIDYVVEVNCIGDPTGIVSGTLQITKDPTRLMMARNVAKIIVNSGLFKDGFSFQTGAGGASLAAATFVHEEMKKKKIHGSFASGGITGPVVDMLEDGLFDRLLDVQTFDLRAADSILKNPNHLEMSASMYASPHNCGCVVNKLDTVVLGATEIDFDFNVNVNTEVDGALLHGIGGHQDTAAGAKVTIIIAPLLRGRVPSVVEKVQTVTTPGETVDVLVTERGIAVNPKRNELKTRLKDAKLPVVEIQELYDICVKFCGHPKPIEHTDKIVAVVEYRDGSILDVVREVKK